MVDMVERVVVPDMAGKEDMEGIPKVPFAEEDSLEWALVGSPVVEGVETQLLVDILAEH